MRHNRLEVIRATAAMLGSGVGARPERTSNQTIYLLHHARTLSPAIAARVYAVYDSANEAYNLAGERGSIIATMVQALDTDMSAEECREAIHAVMRYAPDAFCRHCLRPLVEFQGALHDDAGKDRQVCFRALNYQHARASKADLPAMGVTTEETHDAPS